MKSIILTGDDFGLAVPVNEAIIEAHRNGALTTASLMVGAECTRDAVVRAGACPSLKVGLHLVLVEGRSVLPPEEIPDLVDSKGEFSSNLVRSGFKYFFRPGIRQQLEAEIRAQFTAFIDTGLSLDHVNTHNHMHLHPTILAQIVNVGKEYGLKAVRLPYEPPIRAWKSDGKGIGSKILYGAFLSPWLTIMKRKLSRADIRHNDALFGMADSGGMTLDLVLRMLQNLPSGVTELHFHPATRRCPEIDATMSGYAQNGSRTGSRKCSQPDS
ncbi:MAG: hopanoid biosynthesis-associated protein HpnK [Acidobacteriota bacterium]